MKVTYRVLVATDELYSAYTSPLFRIDDYNRPARNDSRHNQGAYFFLFGTKELAQGRTEYMTTCERVYTGQKSITNCLFFLFLSFCCILLTRYESVSSLSSSSSFFQLDINHFNTLAHDRRREE